MSRNEDDPAFSVSFLVTSYSFCLTTSQASNKRPNLGDGPTAPPPGPPKKSIKQAIEDRRKAALDVKAKLAQADGRERELKRDVLQLKTDLQQMLDKLRARDEEILQLRLQISSDPRDEDIDMSNSLEEFEELSTQCEVLKEALAHSVCLHFAPYFDVLIPVRIAKSKPPPSRGMKPSNYPQRSKKILSPSQQNTARIWRTLR